MIDRDNFDRNKIVLGISGGVDSTTAALLLLTAGYQVYGFYFDVLTGREEGKNRAFKALKEAYAAFGMEKLAEERFLYKDVSKAFSSLIIEDFYREYTEGRTPNPCVLCNPNIKFKYMAEAADQVSAFYMATGHYAGVVYDEEKKVWYIKASPGRKDQSYMLYRLPQEILSRLRFPLEMIKEKDEVRELARNKKMSNSELSDSQEICFLSEGESHGDFIERLNCERNEVSLHNIVTENLPEKFDREEAGRTNFLPKGEFVDKEGNILGIHQGIHLYTIGQRKGLGIALGRPVFVTAIDAGSNRVILGDNEELFKHKVIAGDCFFAETDGREFPPGLDNGEIAAKVRYGAQKAAARIGNLGDGKAEVEFVQAQRAPAPGQSIVFYDGIRVIGGGRILTVS